MSLPERADEIIARMRAEGASRNGILEALEEAGFTSDEAVDAFDGVPLRPRADAIVGDPDLLEHVPAGIGGWLILPAIGLVLGAVQVLRALQEVYEMLADSETLVAVEREIPEMGSLLRLEMAANGILLLAIVVTAILFFSYHRFAPRAFVVFLLLNVVLTIAYVLYAQSVLGAHVPHEDLSSGEILSPLLAAGIWIPYFLTSKRVQKTFVR